MKGNERKAENKMQKNVGAILRTCSQKGITLIALIITIIVMLILVGVTINVALNGGLFTTAQTATKETQIEAEREKLLSALVAVYDISTGTISGREELEEKLGTGWTVEEDDTGYKVTSPDGNVFTVDKKGNITDINGKENGDVKPSSETYTFTVGDFISKEGAKIEEIQDYDTCYTVPIDKFWPENASDELKNSTIIRTLDGWDNPDRTTFNIICTNSNFINVFDMEEEFPTQNFYLLEVKNGLVLLNIYDCDKQTVLTTKEEYVEYSDLAFTISMTDNSNTQTGLTLNPFTIGTLMTACTEVTGTDGKTYYDISIDDFNELISNDTIGQQNILELEDFILTDIESSVGSSIGLDPDLYSAYGVMRPITYNTDPFIFSYPDIFLYIGELIHMSFVHNQSVTTTDPAWVFYINNLPEGDIETEVAIEMIVYKNKNSTSEEDKYFIRFGIGTIGSASDGEFDNLYNKEYIENNYPNVWNAEINILSWKKVNKLMEQHQNCQS